MEPQAFDNLTKRLAVVKTRRGACGVIGGAIAVALGGWLVERNVHAQTPPPKATATPSPTATVQAAATRAPTAAPTPSPTPQATATPTAAPTSTPTAQPAIAARPVATTVPTAAPQVAATQRPVATPAPTVATQPAATTAAVPAQATVAPRPTAAPTQSPASQPASSPVPTATPAAQTIAFSPPPQTATPASGSPGALVALAGTCPDGRSTCTVPYGAPVCCRAEQFCQGVAAPFNQPGIGYCTSSCNGGAACGPGDVCLSSGCCPTGQICGAYCCDPNNNSCPNGGVPCTIGPSSYPLRVCCQPGQICFPGTTTDTGACCPPGQTNLNGRCCPTAQSCGATCCSDGQVCNNGACCPQAQSCASQCCGGDSQCLDNECCASSNVCYQACCHGHCVPPGGLLSPFGRSCFSDSEFAACIACSESYGLCRTLPVPGGGDACDSLYHSCLSAISGDWDNVDTQSFCLQP